MSLRFVQFGAGGHSKVLLETLFAGEPNALVAVLDDNPESLSTTLLGQRVLGSRQWLDDNWLEAPVIPAIGDNDARARLIGWLLQKGRKLHTLVHPSAVVSPSASIGAGSFCAPGAVINAQTMLANGVIVNTSASVDHDCRIGLSAHVAPGARLCGGVTVGDRTLIGTGSVVIPGIKIGADVIVGAGSTVIQNLPDGIRVAGCPAKQI